MSEDALSMPLEGVAPTPAAALAATATPAAATAADAAMPVNPVAAPAKQD
jgi:alginate O-acetyltransferase complex protein AlgJ